MKYFTNFFDRNKYHYNFEIARPSGSRGTTLNSPLISVVMPVFNGSPKWLNGAINSVLGQSYANWELCIVDDASTNGATINVTRGIRDTRVRTLYRIHNAGISATTNEALSCSSGDYITFLD
jgi:O-antigen biosynthesis protein